MYGKTVRLNDETLSILEKYRVFMCEKFESEGEYFAQKMVEHMSLSDLINFAVDQCFKLKDNY